MLFPMNSYIFINCLQSSSMVHDLYNLNDDIHHNMTFSSQPTQTNIFYTSLSFLEGQNKGKFPKYLL